MTLGVRGKLFIVSLVLIAGVGLASGVYLEHELRGWLERRIHTHLLRNVRLGRDLLEVSGLPNTVAALDPIADRLGRSASMRVTIVDDGGRVLGDSQLSPSAVTSVQNHARRPEIRAAFAEGKGSARRYSTTIHTEMLYVALSYGKRKEGGVVRFAMPLSDVDMAIGRLRMVLLLAALVGLGLAVFMTGFASQLATRVLRRLVDHARGVISGKGDRRLPVSSSDELGRLAGSFNRVVEQLDGTVAALAGERDHLETILESMREGVLAVDGNAEVVRLNGAARELLGIGAAGRGQQLAEVVGSDELVALVAKQIEAPERERAAEFALPGGRRALARAAPLRTSGGCVVVMHDVTEMRRLETVRRDFVANVSHELRTPVAVIQANSETLLEGALQDAERAKAFLGAVHRNAERISRIISELLDLARIEAGELRLDPQWQALGPAIRRAVESFETRARGKEQTIRVEEPGEGWVRADSRALDDILINLLDNAIKYTPQGGQICVSVRVSSGDLKVAVSDDGPGIERRHRERVFERFYRVDPGRSRELGGTGLGLSIVKHLVAAMGGEVGVDSNIPSGAIVWFTLPRGPDPSREEGPPASPGRDGGASDDPPR